MRRGLLGLVAMTLLVGGCSNLGLGEASCLPPERGVSAANIMTIQAVPTAKYTPCLDELRLGWDTVEWFAEDGRAGIKITRSISPFLTATVTPSCDVSDAIRVDSGFPDIERYEAIESQAAEIGITIVPSAERPLLSSRLLVDKLEGTEVDSRPVIFTIDDNVDHQVGARVDQALLKNEYVWVISELDAEEGTVELRSNDSALNNQGRGISTTEALELIDNSMPDVFYRGNWYFTFEGGCITYEFNAKGRLAETIATDAEDALGFYPASVVVEVARRQGMDF
ncbi:MAG: hypothetical protein QNL12_07080 [Acidimicrobiia bacterium]|nr:hypothetical protein [Acidimicrobiia bacterium]MDX2467057.1 hypothetical protein [Acidimicrobiia bacterium]